MLVDGSYKSLLQGMSQQPARARLDGQCTLMENMVADAVDGLRRRPPIEYIANIGTYNVNNKIYNYDTGLEQYVIVFGTDASVKVFDLDGVEKTVNNQGAAYLPANPKANLRMTTIGDYTIVANNLVDTALKADTHAAVSAALLYFKDGGEYGRRHRVTIDGVVRADYTTPGGATPATDAAQTGTTWVANQIYAQLVAAGLGATYTFSLKENVILIKRVSGTTPIDVTISDDRGNLLAIVVQEETSKTSDLPLYARPDMVTVITGGGTSDVDDIYMKAVWSGGSSTALKEVVWRETVKRGIQYKFDEATMPHVLVRLLDGTFYFGPLDGGTYGGTTLETWRERASGDTSSNPVRAFAGEPIEFITSFQERLVLLSGDFLIMSSTSSFFNFWNVTATALLKSDPIELANPATKATKLKIALQQSKNLIVFSDDTQFIVGGASGVTPETAAMSIATSFQSDLGSVPVASGSNVFFGITYGVYGGVRELFTDSITAAQDSRKITEHVKRLIGGNITLMQVNSNLGLLALLTDDQKDIVYIYQFLWDGEKRLQSAWSYWTTGGSDVEHFFFKGSNFYFMAHDTTTDEYCIGKMDTADEAETGLDFNIYLDRKATAIPDGNKQFTIPACYIPSDEIVVVRGADCNYPGMSAQIADITSNVVTLVDTVGGTVHYGRKYSSRYKPTMPLMKDRNGIAITKDRLIINDLNISYKNSGPFKVKVTDEWNNATEQEYTGRVTGAINNIVGEINTTSGSFQAGIRKDRNYAEAEIYTDSYLPLSLIDIEWSGQFTKRGRRL